MSLGTFVFISPSTYAFKDRLETINMTSIILHNKIMRLGFSLYDDSTAADSKVIYFHAWK